MGPGPGHVTLGPGPGHGTIKNSTKIVPTVVQRKYPVKLQWRRGDMFKNGQKFNQNAGFSFGKTLSLKCLLLEGYNKRKKNVEIVMSRGQSLKKTCVFDDLKTSSRFLSPKKG